MGGENESDSGFEMVNHSSFDASLVANTNGHGLDNGNEFDGNNGNGIDYASLFYPKSFVLLLILFFSLHFSC